MELQEEKMDRIPYEETFVKLKRGNIVKGKVVRLDPKGILVDIGGKTEGILPSAELSPHEQAGGRSPIRVGDEFDVLVLSEDENGALQVSKKRADLEKTWTQIREAHQTGKILYATAIEHVKGGLVADLGVRGFIPASHVGKLDGRNLEDYVGESLPLKILELDARRGRVVLSHRKAARELSKKKKQLFWKEVYPGEIRRGTVVRLAPFGAFVDLGGVDGLIHLSELSWRRVKHPSDVVQAGDEVEVTVLGLDKEKERVSLSLRRALPDPWTALPESVKPGSILEGAVTQVAKRYVFVEIHPGIEGLIPQEELNRQKRTLKEGEKCRVQIAEIKPDTRRMILSLAAEEHAKTMDPDDYRTYLKNQEDRPLTLKDLIGDQFPAEIGKPKA